MVTFSNNLFLGKVLISLEIVESTNDYARNLLAKTKPLEGTAIIAHNQTRGRGQIGNIWLSEPGKNLTCSIVLYPNFISAAKQFGLTQAIALGIMDALEVLLGKPIAIKWPNDIYCGDKKVAGILVENTISGQNLSDSVVGIGLNVNQTDFNGLPNATSLSVLAGTPLDMEQVRNTLFAHLEKRYLQLRQGHLEQLNHDYVQHLYRLNQWHEFKTPSGMRQGRILGINGFGQLQLETTDGVAFYNNKEVEYII